VSKKRRRKVHEQQRAKWEQVGRKLNRLTKAFRPPTPKERKGWTHERFLQYAQSVHHGAYILAAEHREGAPQKYAEAFRLYRELYERSSGGDVRDACLTSLRALSWELWQLDRDRFPLTLALNFAGELVRRNPLSAPAWEHLALLQQNAGNGDKATSAAEFAVKLDPTLRGSWQTLGRCRLAAGDVREGRNWIERA
jgi:tetratricopeptide (TPR) repeat protein